MNRTLKGALMLAAVIAVSATPAFAIVSVKVPEPATFGLLASGIATIALVRQMRKK